MLFIERQMKRLKVFGPIAQKIFQQFAQLLTLCQGHYEESKIFLFKVLQSLLHQT